MTLDNTTGVDPGDRVWDEALEMFRHSVERVLEAALLKRWYDKELGAAYPWQSLEYILKTSFDDIDLLYDQIEMEHRGYEAIELANTVHQMKRYATALTAVFEGKWICRNCREFHFGDPNVEKGMDCFTCDGKDPFKGGE